MSEKTHENQGFDTWRVFVFYGVIILLFSFYIFRLFSLQVLFPQQYIDRANDNRTTLINSPAQRGTITDRNGVVLARDTASYNLVITPANLPGDTSEIPVVEGAVQEIYRQLSALVGMPVNNGNALDESVVKSFTPCQTDLGIAQIVYIGATNWPYKPIEVKCNIDEATALKIREKASDWPGVGIEVQPVREYPTGVLTSDVIGFLGPVPAAEANSPCFTNADLVNNRDKVGYAGIEAQLQCDDDKNPLVPGNNGKPLLGGVNGIQEIQVDVAGKQTGSGGQTTQPRPGYNVQLTIDTRLQNIAQASIQRWLDFWNNYFPTPLSHQAVVIAMNPKTGEVLAMVSYPSYENNRMARVIPADYYKQLVNDPLKPLFNQAISAEQPPGSTFKLAPSIGILNEGVVTPDKIIDDPGIIYLTTTFSQHDKGFEQPYVCWIYKNPPHVGHGKVDFLTGLSQSCDTYFYKVGGGFKDEVPNGGLGINRLGEYAKALGYGQQTGIELPGESSGLIPTPKWKRIMQGENWSSGDTYIATIGQGYVLSTPIQVLMSASVIADNGEYIKPTLIKSIMDTEGHTVYQIKPDVVWDITKKPLITEFDKNGPIYLRDANNNPIPDLDANGKQKTDQFGAPLFQYQKKAVAPWVVKLVQEGMRKVVVDGTASGIFTKDFDAQIPSSGKTGTAEYCDDIANKAGLCAPGNWPAHAWYVGYAPYDNPEIAVLAFVYHGTEGSTVAAPIVKDVLQGYFALKQDDLAAAKP